MGYCLFPLFLGEVLSVFRCSGRLWSVCSLFVSWFFGFPFGNKFLFIQKKKRKRSSDARLNTSKNVSRSTHF